LPAAKKKGMSSMLNGPNRITNFGTTVIAIAGYCTDQDRLPYVMAADKNGYVYKVTWDPGELFPGYPPVEFKLLGHFDNLVTLAGFYAPDDHTHHAVIGTRVVDPAHPTVNKLHELWFKSGETPNLTELDPHPPFNSFAPKKGMAGFYSLGDDYRHAVIVDEMGKLVDFTWKGHYPTKDNTITIPPTLDRVASISGFLSTDSNPNTRHIIVALKDTGQIYDIAYPYGDHDVQNWVITSFHEPVQNVTAFFSSDTNYRHIVVLTQANFLKDHAYDSYGGNLGSTQLTSSALANVADITSFYSAHDQLRHVVYATTDGNLYEITYTSQG